MEHKFLNFIGIISVIAAIAVAAYTTRGTNMTIGINLENMDTTVNPGTNFYDYATLGWRRANTMPDDYSRYGIWEVMANTNLARVREIAETDDGKIGKLYKIAMDAEKLNCDETRPVAPQIAEIDAIKSADELPAFLGRMHGISSAFWGDGVALDEMDSDHYLYNIYQGGLGLARDYFFDNDEKSVEIRGLYKKYIAKLMSHFGIDADSEKIYAMEERMAKSFYPKEKLRDPHANYHKMSVEAVKQKFPDFDWDAYLSARGAAQAKDINIAQPEAIATSIQIMHDTDLELIKSYLKFKIANSAASVLDDATYDIAFDFYNRAMAGQKEPKPRWKRAIAMLDGAIGDEIGRLYVKKYFPAAAKERMLKLVENLRRAYAMRIENLEWMSDATKARALEKLNRFNVKIGYPDKWIDYSKLEIRDDSLWENMMRVARFEDKYWRDKIGREKDPTIWYMNAHEINAYYDPSMNEICFPAGILQPPFFDMDADDAFNYGAIGAIIGHEMTHGFDDSGRNFDANGNMQDWWTPEDAAAFNARANVMREFFNKIEIAPGVNANGEFTLGENLADYGGMTIAFTAYKNFGDAARAQTVSGLSPDMRFFLANAGVWAAHMRPDEEIRRTKMDEHSLGKNRVNGIYPHLDAWYDAFGITPGDKMYVAPANRVKLW